MKNPSVSPQEVLTCQFFGRSQLKYVQEYMAWTWFSHSISLRAYLETVDFCQRKLVLNWITFINKPSENMEG